MADEVQEVVEEPEDPSRAHNSSCMTAAILAFGSPLMFALLASSASGLFLVACPILILMSLVGFGWGLGLMIMGDPANRATTAVGKVVGDVPPQGSYAERLPETDEEGRLL